MIYLYVIVCNVYFAIIRTLAYPVIWIGFYVVYVRHTTKTVCFKCEWLTAEYYNSGGLSNKQRVDENSRRKAALWPESRYHELPGYNSRTCVSCQMEMNVEILYGNATGQSFRIREPGRKWLDIN